MSMLIKSQLPAIQSWVSRVFSQSNMSKNTGIHEMSKRIDYSLSLAKISEDMGEPTLFYSADKLCGTAYHIGMILFELINWCDERNVSVELLLNCVAKDIEQEEERTKTISYITVE